MRETAVYPRYSYPIKIFLHISDIKPPFTYLSESSIASKKMGAASKRKN